MERVLSLAALYLSGTLSALVAVIVASRFRLYSRRIRIPLALLLLLAAGWATAAAFRVAGAEAGVAVPWVSLEWVALAALPTLWYVFVVRYADGDRALSRDWLLALSVEPTLVACYGLGLGGMSGRPAAVADLFAVGGLAATTVAPSAAGPVADGTTLSVGSSLGVLGATTLSLHAGYTLLLGGVGHLTLHFAGDRRSSRYRSHARVLSAAGAVPLAAALGGAVGVVGWTALPASFGVSALVVLVALSRPHLFGSAPPTGSVAFEAVDDGVLVLDGDGRIVELNPAAGELLRPDRPDLLGERFGDALGPTSPIHDLIASDRPEAVSFAVERDGETRYYECRVAAADRHLGVGETVVHFRDVTDRRRTEHRYRALIENAEDLIAVFEPNDGWSYVSPSVTRVLGYRPADIFEMEPFELVHPADRDRVSDVYGRVVETGEPARTEFRMRHADGSWRTFEASAVDLLDVPAVEGLVVTARDVTERTRYEQRLRVLNRVLRHDLRNDMNVVLGNTEVLLDTDLTSEQRERLRTVREKASSLVDLGDRTRLLDGTTDGPDADPRPVDLLGVVEAAAADLAERHPAAEVVRDLPSAAWVHGGGRLDVAVENLVENAVEHNDRETPRVDLTVTTGPEEVVLRVADDGPGLPQSEVEVLRAGTETPLQHLGGVGLWLVTWIVEGLGGELAFETNDPRGTVAVVRLPAADPPDADPPDTGTGDDGADGDDTDDGTTAPPESGRA